jgi:hypothetical protein
MPDTITLPPILIDPINFSTGPSYEITPTIIQRGSVLYQILISYDTITPTIATLHAFRSTDNGVTWAEQDAAGTPDAGSQSGYFYTFNDPSRNAIDVLYRNGTLGSPGNHIIICTFNTSTNTWGTPGTPFAISTIPGNATIIRYCIYKQSGGDWVVISARLSFGPTVIRLYYLTYDGATWSGSTNLTSANNDGGDVWGGRLNANGNFYFLSTGGASAHDLFLYQLDPTFVLSTKITLTPPGVFFNSSFPSADMSMTFWGADSIAVGWVSTSGNVQMRIGTPLSAPVFTSYTIASTTGSEAFYYARPIVDASGNLNVFWIKRDASTTPITNQIYRSTFNGSSWSSPIVFYDAVVDPPPGIFPGFTVTLLHKFDAIELSPGVWVVFTTMGGISYEHANIGFTLITSIPEPGCPTIYIARQPQPDAPAPPLPPGM